jgi:lipoprotein-releasing system permease protein
MFGSLSLFIGIRFSRAKKRNKLVSFISLSSTIGIAFGVAVIIIGLSAMNGFEYELKQRVLSVIPHGEFEGVRSPISNWSSVQKQIETDSRVIATAPYVSITALAEKGLQLKALSVRGVDVGYESKVSNLVQFITPGAWSHFRPGEQQVILGQGIAQTLGVKIGDSLTLMIPVKGSEDNTQMPKRVRVTVSGLLVLNGQLDHSLALVPMADAQTYADLGDAISGIAIKTNDVLNASNIVKEIGSKLDVFVYLHSWQNKFGYLYRDIQMVRTILYLVMILVIGVACFNIVSTLMMAVKDRSSEIAILRTMGATDGLIKRIFIWQGVFSGVLGSIVGGVLGSVIAYKLTPIMHVVESLLGHKFLSGDIYFVDFLPSQVNVFDVVLVAVTSVMLSLLATWYPAARASRLEPAAVLRAK